MQGAVKKGDDGWKRCNVAAQLVVCEFTVTSLDEKLVYEFRVSAQNQVGMSLPCNLEGAVIPREILGEDFIKLSLFLWKPSDISGVPGMVWNTCVKTTRSH